MDVPLIAAGFIAIIGAAIHGFGGEVLVVRKLSPATLPSTSFGGPGMTRTMIHATWHMTTVAFLTAGGALLAAGLFLDGDAAQAAGFVAAAAATGFAALAVGLGGYAQSPRVFFRHPGPPLLTAVAVLAWWGTLA